MLIVMIADDNVVCDVNVLYFVVVRVKRISCITQTSRSGLTNSKKELFNETGRRDSLHRTLLLSSVYIKLQLRR